MSEKLYYKEKVYCSYCKRDTNCEVFQMKMADNICGKKYMYDGIVLFCKECGHKIDTDSLLAYNQQKLKEIYEKESNGGDDMEVKIKMTKDEVALTIQALALMENELQKNTIFCSPEGVKQMKKDAKHVNEMARKLSAYL